MKSLIGISVKGQHATILFIINHLFTYREVLLFNTNYSIEYYSLIFTQSTNSKYCSVILIIQFRPTVKEFQVLLFNIGPSIEVVLP